MQKTRDELELLIRSRYPVLYLLTWEEARAERLLREKPAASPEERIDYAYRLCLNRPPAPAETARLRKYLNDQRAQFVKERDSAASFFPLRIEGVAAEEAAAWAGVSSVVLNLDGFVTRE